VEVGGDPTAAREAPDSDARCCLRVPPLARQGWVPWPANEARSGAGAEGAALRRLWAQWQEGETLVLLSWNCSALAEYSIYSRLAARAAYPLPRAACDSVEPRDCGFGGRAEHRGKSEDTVETLPCSPSLCVSIA